MQAGRLFISVALSLHLGSCDNSRAVVQIKNEASNGVRIRSGCDYLGHFPPGTAKAVEISGSNKLFVEPDGCTAAEGCYPCQLACTGCFYLAANVVDSGVGGASITVSGIGYGANIPVVVHGGVGEAVLTAIDQTGASVKVDCSRNACNTSEIVQAHNIVFTIRGPAPGSLLWSFSTGRKSMVQSSPVLSNGTVYIAAEGVGSDGEGRKLFALDSVTGDKRWAYDTGRDVDGWPSVGDGSIYIRSDDGIVHAVNAATGAELWTRATGDEHAAVQHLTSPVVSNGKVYVGSTAGAGALDHFFALSAATGNVLWQRTVAGQVESQPLVADGVVYVVSVHSTYAFDAETGKERWTQTAGGGRSRPALAQGILYVSTKSQATVGPDFLRAFNAATGELLWSQKVGLLGSSSPLVFDGIVYVGDNGGTFWAFNASSGAVLWTYKPTSTAGPGKLKWFGSSPTVSGDTVYVGSFDQNVYALDARKGHLRWSYTTAGRVLSSPYLQDGVLYVGSGQYPGLNGMVYALQASPPETLQDVTILI